MILYKNLNITIQQKSVRMIFFFSFITFIDSIRFVINLFVMIVVKKKYFAILFVSFFLSVMHRYLNKVISTLQQLIE